MPFPTLGSAEEFAANPGCKPCGRVLESAGGDPMKGSTVLVTLRRLGIVRSFSRPHVSDDNPYSEALFRALKYQPEFPRDPFTSLEAARQWIKDFVTWYNTEHLHRAIRFVTHEDRHAEPRTEETGSVEQLYATTTSCLAAFGRFGRKEFTFEGNADDELC